MKESITLQQERLEILERKENILKEIRTIVGKSLSFSKVYLDKKYPKVGKGERPFTKVTQKYVYVNCWAVDGYDKTEMGTSIRRCPIYYSPSDGGRMVDKVALDAMFLSDLHTILNELKFYIWWEKDVHFPSIEKEYKETLEIVNRFANI